MAFKLNGKILPIDVQFQTGGRRYPKNFLRISTPEEKKAIGITEVPDDPVIDYRFYVSDGVPQELDDKNATDAEGNLKKNLDGSQRIIFGLKTIWINRQKEEANNKLSKYDWQVTRKAEKGVDISSAVATYRDAVRTVCATRETEIKNCADVAALKTLVDGVVDKDGTKSAGLTDWRRDPDSQL